MMMQSDSGIFFFLLTGSEGAKAASAQSEAKESTSTYRDIPPIYPLRMAVKTPG